MEPQPASEIQAWAQGCGHRLQPWEFEALLAASRAYVAEYQADEPVAPDRVQPQVNVARKFKKLVSQVNAKC